jgi:hypothetical protein
MALCLCAFFFLFFYYYNANINSCGNVVFNWFREWTNKPLMTMISFVRYLSLRNRQKFPNQISFQLQNIKFYICHTSVRANHGLLGTLMPNALPSSSEPLNSHINIYSNYRLLPEALRNIFLTLKKFPD